MKEESLKKNKLAHYHRSTLLFRQTGCFWASILGFHLPVSDEEEKILKVCLWPQYKRKLCSWVMKSNTRQRTNEWKPVKMVHTALCSCWQRGLLTFFPESVSKGS